ncbi:MAG: glycosyltransferase family 2 protein [Rhodospirillales bacterium]|nr:glycosyltransferase family 2 protein [Rhodospirillales bacterium]
MPKVSVILTAHNYGRYVSQAIESVVKQTFDSWELIIVDDGSTDDTPQIAAHYARHPKISVLTLPGLGLARAANAGIRASKGRYVVRLDADDYFDENLLLILSNVLDRHPEYGMVFPDYYQISQHGEVIDLVRHPKVNDEVTLLDRSALAAGCLYRRSCWDRLNGYNEELKRQEDYDFWVRFIEHYRVYNVQLPLMYYRRHEGSMSVGNPARKVAARRLVKRQFAETRRAVKEHHIVGVLPIIRQNRFMPGLALEKVGGRPLMAYAIEHALNTKLIDRVVVNTEDEEIAEVARKLGAEVPFLRPRSLAKLSNRDIEVHRQLVTELTRLDGVRPDFVISSSYNCPFITSAHLEEALHTLLMFRCSSVIGVGLNIRYHWQQSVNGLVPVLYPRHVVKDQKWNTYEERGGLVAYDTRNLIGDNLFGDKVSFIEIDEEEGVRVDSPYHLWLTEQLLANQSPAPPTPAPTGRSKKKAAKPASPRKRAASRAPTR